MCEMLKRTREHNSQTQDVHLEQVYIETQTGKAYTHKKGFCVNNPEYIFAFHHGAFPLFFYVQDSGFVFVTYTIIQNIISSEM